VSDHADISSTVALAAESVPPAITRVIRVQRSQGWVALKLGDLWDYRELVYFLTWRDVKVRYKQTVLGAAWAILQPFLTMLVFSLVFGRLAKMPSDGIPYPLFSFAALVPWSFFANGLTQSSNSLVGSANLITKVYFPRLAVPVATILSGVIDFVLAFAVLVAMMAYYRIAPSPHVIWLPVFMLLALLAALGTGLWLSAMNVQFRDVRYTVPFLTQFWLFATPIAYPLSLFKDAWKQSLFALNPMVGAVEGFRWAIFGASRAPVTVAAVSLASALLLVVSGALYFRRMERTFADIV
jgi:lipopolysaccharide transport system permease protein